MTVKEVAKRLDLTVYAVYKQIKERRGVGKKFEYRAGTGWFLYSKDLPKRAKK